MPPFLFVTAAFFFLFREGSDDIYEYNGKDGVECDPMYPGQAVSG